MARRSSGRSASRPVPRAASVRNPPQPACQTPPLAPAQNGGGSIIGGIGSMIYEGFTFCTGGFLAQRVVDAVLGPRTIELETVVSEAAVVAPMMNGADSCGNHSKAFQDCLNHCGSDISKCQFYLDMLNECRRGGVTA